jgi:hypothetical protein
MPESSLPPEVELAESCSIAIEAGNFEAAKAHAEAGLRLATEKGSVKWMLRFKLLLTRCDPNHAPEVPSSTPEPMNCSFCGLARSADRELVAGPRVLICERCVNACLEVTALSQGIQRLKDPGAACSFCARQAGPTGAMYARGADRICGDCVETCLDIFKDMRA